MERTLGDGARGDPEPDRALTHVEDSFGASFPKFAVPLGELVGDLLRGELVGDLLRGDDADLRSGSFAGSFLDFSSISSFIASAISSGVGGAPSKNGAENNTGSPNSSNAKRTVTSNLLAAHVE